MIPTLFVADQCTRFNRDVCQISNDFVRPGNIFLCHFLWELESLGMWHLLLLLTVCAWSGKRLLTSPWLQVSALFAVLLGVCMAEVGVSIQHDANHGAYSKNSWLEYTLGTTLDVIGASSFMWKQQHVVGHHTYTNVEGLDPDIRVKDPDVRRVSQHQPWQSYQASDAACYHVMPETVVCCM